MQNFARNIPAMFSPMSQVAISILKTMDDDRQNLRGREEEKGQGPRLSQNQSFSYFFHVYMILYFSHCQQYDE